MAAPNETPKSPENMPKLSTQEELAALKLETDKIQGETITTNYDLGASNIENEGKSKIIESKYTKLKKIESSVDATRHKKRPENLMKYKNAAANIFFYKQYFDKDTLSLYAKNQEIIQDISDTDIGNWDQIIERHGSQLTSKDGALNFILAFMRAEDTCNLKEKVENNQLEKGFFISLKIGSKWDSKNERYANVEIKYPQDIIDINTIINQNKALLIEQGDPNLWNQSISNLHKIFQNSQIQNLFNKLYNLKNSNPELFNLKENYDGILTILGQNLYTYYFSFGANSPYPSQFTRFQEFKREGNPKSVAYQLQDPITKALNRNNFWPAATLNNPQNLPENIKNDIKIYEDLKMQIARNAVFPIEKAALFLSLTTRLNEYYASKGNIPAITESYPLVTKAIRALHPKEVELLEKDYSQLISSAKKAVLNSGKGS